MKTKSNYFAVLHRFNVIHEEFNKTLGVNLTNIYMFREWFLTHYTSGHFNCISFLVGDNSDVARNIHPKHYNEFDIDFLEFIDKNKDGN